MSLAFSKRSPYFHRGSLGSSSSVGPLASDPGQTMKALQVHTYSLSRPHLALLPTNVHHSASPALPTSHRRNVHSNCTTRRPHGLSLRPNKYFMTWRDACTG